MAIIEKSERQVALKGGAVLTGRASQPTITLNSSSKSKHPGRPSENVSHPHLSFLKTEQNQIFITFVAGLFVLTFFVALVLMRVSGVSLADIYDGKDDLYKYSGSKSAVEFTGVEGGYPYESYYGDLVADELAFEKKVSTREQESIREFFTATPQDNKARVEAISLSFKKSPDGVIQQVHRIIASTNRRQIQAMKLANSIVNEALRQQYDPLFVAAVIKSESAFNELAVSHVGAQGLMQIMPATGKYLAAKHEPNWPTAVKLSDPQVNIKLGIKYLRELEGMYKGNRLLTLIAYNWGPGKLDRAIRSGRGVPAECLRYALKILKDHNYWETSPT